MRSAATQYIIVTPRTTLMRSDDARKMKRWRSDAAHAQLLELISKRGMGRDGILTFLRDERAFINFVEEGAHKLFILRSVVFYVVNTGKQPTGMLAATCYHLSVAEHNVTSPKGFLKRCSCYRPTPGANKTVCLEHAYQFGIRQDI